MYLILHLHELYRSQFSGYFLCFLYWILLLILPTAPSLTEFILVLTLWKTHRNRASKFSQACTDWFVLLFQFYQVQMWEISVWSRTNTPRACEKVLDNDGSYLLLAFTVVLSKYCSILGRNIFWVGWGHAITIIWSFKKPSPSWNKTHIKTIIMKKEGFSFGVFFSQATFFMSLRKSLST